MKKLIKFKRYAKHKERMKVHDAHMRKLKSVMTSRRIFEDSKIIVDDFVPFEEPNIKSVVAVNQMIKKRFSVRTQHKSMCQLIREK